MKNFLYWFMKGQMLARVLGIISQDLGVYKSDWFLVDIFQFFLSLI